MQTPKYTFLLPAFKAKYLAEMLESIKNQTYTDFKVLISDDCSPEPILKECEHYLSDHRFTYRRNEENMGSKSLVSHWNLLVEMCDTEFLIMASDDDVYAPTFLEEIDKLQVKYPKVDLLRARTMRIDQDGSELEKDHRYEEHVNELDYIVQQYYNHKVQCVGNFVFRSKMLKEKGGFIDFPLAWYSDYATPIDMAANGTVNTENILFLFRDSGINISSYKGESRRQSYLKCLATIQYKSWLSQVLSKFDKNFSRAQKSRIDFINSCMFADTDHMLRWSSIGLGWRDFFNILRLARKNNFGILNLFLFYIKH